MGLFGSKEKIYGEPIPYKKFVEIADVLMMETEEEFAELDRCVNEKDVDLPVTLRCRKQISVWNERLLKAFCKNLYDTTVKCQKNAGVNWHLDCKAETNELMHCGDDSMRRLYQFNLTRKKNEAKGTQGE
eukprot:TRINITY_DN21141_c0_g1_i1.p1 TRINITY_DN21141_c0_g1~~TRINITY_DN21141_c0_g1_i1.p1  ORF type:complete len:152 (+),score=26.04 TRINITY_DN21141_c0_g1_i1:68-457(+)